jgi:hypothetical protein
MEKELCKGDEKKVSENGLPNYYKNLLVQYVDR